MAKLNIAWEALFKVAGFSIVVGVAVIAVFAVGVLGLTRIEAARADGTAADRRAGYLLAGTCFAACAAALLYGLYLIIPQFHQ